MKICCFAGHATLYDSEVTIKSTLKKEIANLIENENVTTFYSGGKGAFDWLCAETVNELRVDYSFIKSYWVLSYMPREKDEFPGRISKIFDDTVYPDMENVPKRLAIIKSNEWIVNNSEFLIEYVKHDLGSGAYKTLEYAKKKKHIIAINIA